MNISYLLPPHQVLLSIMYWHQRRVFLFGCCCPVAFGVELHERLAPCHFYQPDPTFLSPYYHRSPINHDLIAIEFPHLVANVHL
jgi:hypothetical protein